MSIFKEARHVFQKNIKLGEERRQSANLEAAKLLNVEFIGEAQYTSWLANVVLVKKSSKK